MYQLCRIFPISSAQLTAILRCAHTVSTTNQQNVNSRRTNNSDSYAASMTNQQYARPRRVDNNDRFGTMGYKALQTEKLVTRHRFRHEIPSTIIDDKWERFNFGADVPVIETPLVERKKFKSTKRREAREKLAYDLAVRASSKTIIECKRSENNHYENMRYPNLTTELPMYCQYWDKNKYADDWFIIHRTTSLHATMTDSIDRTWEEFFHMIHPQIFRNIIGMKFKAPTRIQYDFFLAYPTAEHVFMAAETGSGKTLAYGASILSKLIFLREKQPKAKALILTPSTHLKEQTAQKLQAIVKDTPLKVVSTLKNQKYASDDFDVLVSTPGLAYKILKQLGDSISVRYFVMDESDMLLDDSFVKEVGNILSVVPIKSVGNSKSGPKDGTQIVFCSATCPPELTNLVNEIVDDRHILYVTSKYLHKVLPNIQQKFLRVREKDKVQHVVDILTKETKLSKHKILIFCKDNNTAEYLSHELSNQHGFSSLLMTHKNNNTFDKLNEESSILIATDMGSRGLDIQGLTHVLNYDFPRHLVDYVHRIGRVGRCSTGNSKHYVTSFVRLPHEVEDVKAIELAVRLNRPIQGIETNVSGLLKEKKLGAAEQN